MEGGTAGANIVELLGMNEEELLQLVWKMKDPKTGISVKDRKKALKTYKNCFVGKEAIDWLTSKGIVMNRDEGIQLCNEFIKRNIFVSASSKPEFRDDNVFFRFVEDKPDVDDSEDSNKVKYRICVLGDERSGKSAMCIRFVKDEFSLEYVNTKTEEYYRKENWEYRGEKINVEILDTGSIVNEDFEKNLGQWNEWATGFILVYNITSRTSFELIPKLFTTLIKVRQYRMTPVLLVGTKADLLEERKVTKEEGQNLAQRYRCDFVETSARTRDGIQSAFSSMANAVVKVNLISGPITHKTGWLRMRTSNQKQYKRRYFVMTDSGLRYYKEEPESPTSTAQLKGVVPMQNCQVDIIESFGERRRFSSPDVDGRKTPNASETPSPERRMSDSDQNSPVSMSMAAVKAKFARQTSTQGLLKDKLRIILIDNSEKEYDILCSSEEERDEWYTHLARCAAKANVRPMSHSFDDNIEEKDKDPSTLTAEEAFQQSISRFNKNPIKGMKFLLASGHLENSPKAVAKYLFEQKTLKKTAVGDYLGDGDPFNIEVLKEFLDLIDFTGVTLDEGLRKFLAKFTIPGEAQKIDRIMEKFASRYCACNPGVFEIPDVGYILAFSLIMLNTDAHNPNIKQENKMTKAQFVANNRGINNGKDLDRAFLEDLYDRIVSQEIAMEYERDDFAQWDKQGWIYMKEFKTKAPNLTLKKSIAKKVWCIISGCCLYMFENPTDKKPIHIIPLGNLTIDSVTSEEKENDTYGFMLYNQDPKDEIKTAVEGKEVRLKELLFIVDDRKSKMEWMLTFKMNLVTAPSYKS